MNTATATETKTLTSLTIIVREWFDKTYGNTYHSAKIVANGETVTHLPMTYGRGDLTYLEAASKAVQEAGYANPAWSHTTLSAKTPGFSEYREAGVPVVIDVAQVARRKDLHLWQSAKWCDACNAAHTGRAHSRD